MKPDKHACHLFGSERCGDDGFELFVEIAAGQKNTTFAAAADEANIRSQSHDLPLVAAAWMFLAETNDVSHMNLYVHNIPL